MAFCPRCKGVVDVMAISCPHCQFEFGTEAGTDNRAETAKRLGPVAAYAGFLLSVGQAVSLVGCVVAALAVVFTIGHLIWWITAFAGNRVPFWENAVAGLYRVGFVVASVVSLCYSAAMGIVFTFVKQEMSD